MAAEVNVRWTIEASGLDTDIDELRDSYTDSRTPTDIFAIKPVISTTANLISTITNVPSSAIIGLGLKARGDTVFFNTISTNISTAGQAVPENQGIINSFISSNSCKLALKGNAADAAVTLLFWVVVT